MNIQGNINQLLSTIGRAAGISAIYKATVKEPSVNKSAGEKQLSGKTQKRVSEFMESPNRYNTPVSKVAASQLSAVPKDKILDARKRFEANNRMREKATASINQNEEFGSIKEQILHPEKYMKGDE